MKKYIIFLLTFACLLNLHAEFTSNRRSNPNYKDLKVYVKVIKHYKNSNFYLTQIEIQNKGKHSISFWETSNYAMIFGFTAGGIEFVSQNQPVINKNKIPDIVIQRSKDRKVRIMPNGKYFIKARFYIHNRKLFLKTNNNLRVIFLFNDANLGFSEDVMSPKIISKNIFDYNW